MKLPQDWQEALQGEVEKPYYQELVNTIKTEYEQGVVYPAYENIYRALQLTPFHHVKVVILGQDPYHNEGQAHGLAFSVETGISIPKSLQNIYKELEADIGCGIPTHGNLQQWATQGVLLLNTVLTVREHSPESHKNIGWEQFTDQIISCLNGLKHPIVFILWGAPARKKAQLITNKYHFIIESAHPSPLSAYRGFWGSRPFSRTNEFLESCKLESIDWFINS